VPKEAMIKMLEDGIAATHLVLSDTVCAQLVEYLETLAKWNRIYNLTAIQDPIEMVQKHVLDSLILSPYLGPGRVIDVGTGAGLPGIPLALSRPDQSFVLLDSNQKKITFVEHMILSLKLKNVMAVCLRVEQYQPEDRFDWVISRAFASLGDFARLSRHLCKPEGHLVAMKGLVSQTELQGVLPPCRIEKIEEVRVPGLEAARSFVFMAVDCAGGVSC
jgi:16S rRNA (guanine527-N7)-methyltransferase